MSPWLGVSFGAFILGWWVGIRDSMSALRCATEKVDEIRALHRNHPKPPVCG